ncbi:sugar porter family MFS transporter [Silvibacterium acidisoli]|uniref:sugar porter family MFS transporter n=1 Tax=Acidobacteriaceae bacterium ZG23-2 TaxID=2883246 RepID=UPI00406C1A88
MSLTVNRLDGDLKVRPASKRAAVESAVTAALGGLLFGFDTAVIAGVTSQLRTQFQLTPSTLGFTVAIALWGTILGAAIGGAAGDRFGRRASLRGLALVFVVSSLGCAVAPGWLFLIAFRFIAGVAIGASSVIGPMYIAEIAPSSRRGSMVATFQLNIVLGILIAYFSNFVVGSFHLGNEEWRWKLAVSAVPAVLFWLMLFRIPRSPRWLVEKGRVHEAEQVLSILSAENVELELQAIRASIESDRAAGNQPLFSRRYRKCVILAVLTALFNQFSGINPILYYLNDIFSSTGASRVSSDLQAVAIGATNFVGTIIAMTLIDRIGRKKLLLIGAVGTFICLSLTGAFFYSARFRGALVWPLVGFVAFFAVSQGSVIWVYISEIFPNSVRGKGLSLGSFTHWLTCASLSNFFPVVAAHSGGMPFIFFASMMVVQFFVVLRFFPETKGYSLEQLQARLEIT